MDQQSTRRTFLTTVGVAGAVSLTGCSAFSGDGGEKSATSNTTVGSPNTSTSTPTSTPTNTRTSTDNGSGRNNANAPGESIDKFNSVSDQWNPKHGKLITTKQDTFQGKQSVVLKPKKNATEKVAEISRVFYPKALNLSNHDLSLAAKVKKPKMGWIRVRAVLHAPAENTSVTAVRQIPQYLDDWVRFDLGYIGKDGAPDLKNVQEVHLQIGPIPGNKPFQVMIDDLRKVPKAKQGKVMLQFDDGRPSVYETAYPILKEKGWPGSVGVIPDAVGADNFMNQHMLREMGKAGWDMVTHGGAKLHNKSFKEQKRILQQNKRKLELMKFKPGAQHFIVPYHKMNKATLKAIKEIFETGYVQGGCPNNAESPSNSAFISRIDGEDVRGARDIINMAAEFNQLAVLYFHRIGDTKDAFPTKSFKKLIDHIETNDVKVTSPTQFSNNK